MNRYITIDGGTTNTRVCLVEDKKIVDSVKFSNGETVSVEGRKAYADAIRDAIKQILQKNSLAEADICRILASGSTITSEFGLYPLEHAVVPVGIETLKQTAVEVTLAEITSIPFVFVRGVKTACNALEDADMMRGEEAELIGLLREGGDSCAYLLMGSHTKIVRTDSVGNITDIRTMLTGELAQSVAQNTILKHSFSLAEAKLEKEHLIEGYLYCREHGVSEALFKARVLKNIFGASEDAAYSFYMGVILCGDVENTCKLKPSKAVVGGNKKLKDAICILLESCTKIPTEKLSAKEVEAAVPMGLIKIYEY